MEKFGAVGLFMVAAVLFATGLVLRMDLIDWLIDAIGFTFLAAGAITGVVGLLKLVMGGRGGHATSI